MCGISGAISLNETDKWQAIVDAIVADQSCRGPDFSRVERFAFGAVEAIAGHNRLSIIDLSAAAHQPMWTADGKHCLVFNGEIYNFVELRTELRTLGHDFRTTSDSEVLLAAVKAWGREAPKRFNGMFAFAVFDIDARTVLLGRDRFGVKPLYYTTSGKDFAFASTPRVLADAIGAPPNLTYVQRGLSQWFYDDGSEQTQYENVRAVLPGHVVEVRLGADAIVHDVSPYYDLRSESAALVETLAAHPRARLIDHVLDTLQDAVRLRLRSDVPLAVSLSGGLDSSSVAALIKRQDLRVSGFTFGHPDASESEGGIVAEVARHVGFTVDYIWPAPSDTVDSLWRTLIAQDAPFSGPSVVAQYLVFERVRQCGIKVLLGGQGGDEAFMGYRKFQLFALQSAIRKRELADVFAAVGGMARLFVTELPRLAENVKNGGRYIGRSKQRKPDSIVFADLQPQSDVRLSATASLRDRQIDDVLRFSLPTLLRYEDRNSMAHSVESRLPFVDYRVVELGVALPLALKLHGGFGKWAVRAAMRGLLPDVVRVSRYKRGFDVDHSRWIAAGLGAALRARMRSSWSRVQPYVGAARDIDSVFSDQRFAQDGDAFRQAISLLWIASVGERRSLTAVSGARSTS